eukprot:scaffold30523_cov37-Cyclotella_meneghiniana.AAC.6
MPIYADPDPIHGRPRQRFCAGALFHVFARRLAYIFTSLQSLMPTFSRLCIQQNTNKALSIAEKNKTTKTHYPTQISSPVRRPQG